MFFKRSELEELRNIGSRLKEAREHKKITVSKMAKLLRCSRNKIYAIENPIKQGRLHLNLSDVEAYAARTDSSINYLLTGIDHEHQRKMIDLRLKEWLDAINRAQEITRAEVLATLPE